MKNNKKEKNWTVMGEGKIIDLVVFRVNVGYYTGVRTAKRKVEVSNGRN